MLYNDEMAAAPLAAALEAEHVPQLADLECPHGWLPGDRGPRPCPAGSTCHGRAA